MTGVRIGRVVAGGKVHILVCGLPACPVLASRPIAWNANPARVATVNVCGHCARRGNVAAAQQENGGGSRWSAALDDFLSLLVDATRTPEERARIADLVARFKRPIEPAIVDPAPVAVEAAPDLFAETPAPRGFAAVAADLRAAFGDAPAPRHITRVSARKRLAIHNSFAAHAA